ncbi:hypothetical protein B1C78_02095 [Thioalkalivibrio denitrificans]|uniref:SAM-dependent methyltransferase n=1 Tax=Thioalkalivibrio denitrificans TaxID=108003 RepID=A0A1V3NTR2_9GAMM|nr:hypothetical protein [Thioalkalivibrio denitrificans]OOG28126.1 hypothetical protein B1C78_02095 [Thioalkalivibrio denitrificans]
MSAVTVNTGSAAGPGTGGVAASTDAFHAKLLEQALQPLLDGERMEVLDLGNAHGETVDFFSGLRVRFAVAAIEQDLRALDEVDDEDILALRLNELLTEELVGGARVVLAWDLLNYLQPRVISAFMARLADLLPAGALVHGFVAYGVKALPENPRALVICRHGWLRTLTRPDEATRDVRNQAAGNLQRLMPDFRMIRAMLLRDGMQECLFRR